MIPNEYTGCETYRGYTIALRNGSYYVFDTDFDGRDVKLPGSYSTRAGARAKIDFENASSLEMEA